jgi:hypothetical protein
MPEAARAYAECYAVVSMSKVACKDIKNLRFNTGCNGCCAFTISNQALPATLQLRMLCGVAHHANYAR